MNRANITDLIFVNSNDDSCDDGRCSEYNSMQYLCDLCYLHVEYQTFLLQMIFFIHVTVTVNRCVLTSDKINAFDFNLFGENEFMFEL